MTDGGKTGSVPDEKERLAWLVLSRIPHIGGLRCRRLVERFGSARAAIGEVEAWADVIGRAAARKARIRPEDWEWAESQCRELRSAGGRLFTLADPQYPALLREIACPPPVLYQFGDLSLDLPSVAIVGPRRATPYGRKVAEKMGRELAEAGFCVVSGMAAGIDGAAHEGALQAEGATVAVLGCGADVVYPSTHERLYRRIRGRGAVISEFPLGTEPAAGSFPRRNRLISGLSLGVVVVEAPERSGSLITAAYAVEQNREVFAVPGSVLDGRNRGCHRLIREGAWLAESTEDLLTELAQWRPDRPVSSVIGSRRRGKEPEGDGKKLLACLGDAPRPIDELAEESGMKPADLLGLLLEMELEGWVSQLPGKRFVRIT